jgi:hypothetical protein
VLGVKIASFAALAAVIPAVGAQANVMRALAQETVFLAGATGLFPVALRADEFRRHGKTLARLRREENRRAEHLLPRSKL